MVFVFADAPLPPRQSTTNSANICTPRIFCRDPMRTSKTFCLVATGLSRSLPPLLLSTLRRRGRGMRSQAHYTDSPHRLPPSLRVRGEGGSGSFRVMAFVFADAPLLPRQSTTNSANLCNSRIFCRDPMRTSKTFCLVATGLSRSLPPLLLSTLRRRGRGMRSQAHYKTPLIPCPLLPEYGAKGSRRSLGLWFLYSLMLHYRPGNQLPTRQTYVPQDLLPRSHENFQNLLLSCNGSLAIIASPSPQYSEEKGSGDEEPGPLSDSPHPRPLLPEYGAKGSIRSFRVMVFVFADAPLPPRQTTSNSANLCNSRTFCRDLLRTSKTFCLVATGLSRLLPPEEAPDMESGG